MRDASQEALPISPAALTLDEQALHARYQPGTRFNNQAEAQIDIQAPCPLVWRVLTDFENYRHWNPFTPSVGGRLELGTPVELEVHMPGSRPKQQREWINRVQAPHVLCWGVSVLHGSLIKANRWQVLDELPSGGTRYRTVDFFSGWLVPLVFALYGAGMRKGFAQAATGLKQYCEAQARADEG